LGITRFGHQKKLLAFATNALKRSKELHYGVVPGLSSVVAAQHAAQHHGRALSSSARANAANIKGRHAASHGGSEPVYNRGLQPRSTTGTEVYNRPSPGARSARQMQDSSDSANASPARSISSASAASPASHTTLTTPSLSPNASAISSDGADEGGRRKGAGRGGSEHDFGGKGPVPPAGPYPMLVASAMPPQEGVRAPGTPRPLRSFPNATPPPPKTAARFLRSPSALRAHAPGAPSPEKGGKAGEDGAAQELYFGEADERIPEGAGANKEPSTLTHRDTAVTNQDAPLFTISEETQGSASAASDWTDPDVGRGRAVGEDGAGAGGGGGGAGAGGGGGRKGELGRRSEALDPDFLDRVITRVRDAEVLDPDFLDRVITRAGSRAFSEKVSAVAAAAGNSNVSALGPQMSSIRVSHPANTRSAAAAAHAPQPRSRALAANQQPPTVGAPRLVGEGQGVAPAAAPGEGPLGGREGGQMGPWSRGGGRGQKRSAAPTPPPQPFPQNLAPRPKRVAS
jgi:hypothetical protein